MNCPICNTEVKPNACHCHVCGEMLDSFECAHAGSDRNRVPYNRHTPPTTPQRRPLEDFLDANGSLFLQF